MKYGLDYAYTVTYTWDEANSEYDARIELTLPKTDLGYLSPLFRSSLSILDSNLSSSWGTSVEGGRRSHCTLTNECLVTLDLKVKVFVLDVEKQILDVVSANTENSEFCKKYNYTRKVFI